MFNYILIKYTFMWVRHISSCGRELHIGTSGNKRLWYSLRGFGRPILIADYASSNYTPKRIIVSAGGGGGGRFNLFCPIIRNAHGDCVLNI
jgi:hypothetical protein